jgi:hypothetical protein
MNPNKALWEKGDCTRIAVHSQTKLNALARELNERPRRTLAVSLTSVEVRRVCCGSSPVMRMRHKRIRARHVAFSTSVAICTNSTLGRTP